MAPKSNGSRPRYVDRTPPASPSNNLLLPSLKCLYKVNERTQERPQPGGFSSGHDTITVYAIETDHEKVGTLENEHWKV